ncbi:acetylxylan esterase precursor protein [Venturia nashicola]|nr:acetylxylan esterase precursor protein [Venturia nashicola]
MLRPSLLQAALLSAVMGAPLPFNAYSEPFPDRVEGKLVQRQASSCPPSHLIIARGSLEPQGPGQLMAMANKIIAGTPGTTIEAVVYPATIENYGASSGNGTAAVAEMLSSFVQKCPNSKLALLGYSQGAQIIGDAVAGGGIQGVSSINPPIRADISSVVDAMVFYGDPRHNAVATYNVGTADKDGIFTRPTNQTLNTFSEKLQSYCNTNDPFCAQGNDIAVHLNYPQEFDDAAAAFVNKRFQSQQALAKAQGAPAPDSPPTPAQADPVPPAATLVRPEISSQPANSTATTAAISLEKTVRTPWAFAMKSVLGSEVVKRRERNAGIPKNALFEASKRM